MSNDHGGVQRPWGRRSWHARRAKRPMAGAMERGKEERLRIGRGKD